ncbi:MAG: symmetrical bis(5'-nucleosyl)-tetraphosphatase [Acidiferrobacterales bacterium]
MAIYAIGDVQGCFEPLTALLEKIDFNKNRDRLWFTGDLVNRGPDSVAVLRFVRALGNSAITVLGNHDLHLLAIASGHAKQKRRDTLAHFLAADDRDELLLWLRTRPLLHRDSTLGYTMVHAGLAPQWSLEEAQQLAAEVEQILRSDNYREFFPHMYGNHPYWWQSSLAGWDRLRFITNVFTRIRYCDNNGNLDLEQKGAPAEVPAPLKPWFEYRDKRNAGETILFGHWSTLGFIKTNDVICLDGGCLWGGKLIAIQIDHPDLPVHCVDCEQQQALDRTG